MQLWVRLYGSVRAYLFGHFHHSTPSTTLLAYYVRTICTCPFSNIQKFEGLRVPAKTIEDKVKR